METSASYKAKDTAGQSGFSRYRAIYYGPQSIASVLRAEFLMLLIGNIPGALGLLLRKWFCPSLFQACGSGVIFGRNLTLRHAHKISLGSNVIVDDDVVLDAKGDNNRGIRIASGVYIGRHTIIYCKNGDIELGENVNISSNCQLFSSNRLSVGNSCVIAAFTYLMSGGMYDYRDSTPFAAQSGLISRGPTEIAANCWIGAHVVVLDGSMIGEHSVIGAGAVVTGKIEKDSVALGIPARAKQKT